MTAIAYRNGVLAADSGLFSEDNLILGRGEKIKEVAPGWWCAAAGDNAVGLRLERLLKARRIPSWIELKEIDGGGDGSSCQGILVTPRMIHVFDIGAGFEPMTGDYAVAGACGSFMMGALAAGLSAEDAVKLACQHHAFALDPVQVVRVRERT